MYRLVFQEAASYSVSASGEVLLLVKRVFDETGNIKEELSYDSDGNLTGRRKHEYDGNNREISVTGLIAENVVAWRTTYQYDASGRCTEQKNWKANDSGELEVSDRWTNEYDADGNRIRTNHYRQNETVCDYTIWDSEGNVLEEIKETGEHYRYTYNENGDLMQKKQISLSTPEEETILEEKRYGEDGRLLEYYYYGTVHEYNYNDRGVLTEERANNSDGSLTVTEYDEKENIVRVTDYDGETVNYMYTYEYNEYGRERKKVYVSGDEQTVTEWEYEENEPRYGENTRYVVKDADGNVLRSHEEIFINIRDDYKWAKNMTYKGGDETKGTGSTLDYDEYGNAIRRNTYLNGDIVAQEVYEYLPFAVPITENKDE